MSGCQVSWRSNITTRSDVIKDESNQSKDECSVTSKIMLCVTQNLYARAGSPYGEAVSRESRRTLPFTLAASSAIREEGLKECALTEQLILVWWFIVDQVICNFIPSLELTVSILLLLYYIRLLFNKFLTIVPVLKKLILFMSDF